MNRTANYGLGEILIMCISKVYTNIFFNNARLIRLPSRIRGKKGLEYGKGFTTGYSCRIEISGNTSNKKLIIGSNCIIGDYVHIAANKKILIGDNVLIASRVFITDTSHGNYNNNKFVDNPYTPPNERKLVYSEVIIGDNVWIGENVSILPGVKIGKGCIIGANSVVTKNIPDNCIVAGVPTKIIKKYSLNDNEWKLYNE